LTKVKFRTHRSRVVRDDAVSTTVASTVVRALAMIALISSRPMARFEKE